VHAEPEFCGVTKTLHNALQGGEQSLGEAERELYLRTNEQTAKLLSAEYDVFMVHDPQPAAIRHFAGPREARWIWRCHIDSSEPNRDAAEFLRPYLDHYDAFVFTLPAFVLPDLDGPRNHTIAPAIDPLAAKNMAIPLDVCRRATADCGVDVNRPLLLQVSRFDPWKDPMGVLEAYRLVTRELPVVQLVFIGGMAGDDPEGWQLLEQVERAAQDDPDVYVFTNLGGVGSMEVNVFQRTADVVIQKSLREGFGLVVSEALWKETPVVAGNVGGIPMQVPEGFGANLVDSVEDCAARVLELLRRPSLRGAYGRAGHEHVRRHFLLPRLIRDELKLIRELL
jgi:trehalose synthase